MSSNYRAVLAGTGISVPPRSVDNDLLSKVMNTSHDWIVERSGITKRHYVEAGVSSSDLGAEAARQALADAEMDASELDYIVLATMTPDHYFPGAGTLIQQRLGIAPLPCLDIRQQCAGFAYGLQLVSALVASGIARNVLLVGADVHSCLMPFGEKTWDVIEGRSEAIDPAEREINSKHRHLLVLFGDGAGAMVFRRGSGDTGILGSRLYGDGENVDILRVPGVGSSSRPFITAASMQEEAHIPVMQGRKVFKLAVTLMPRVTRELLAEHDLTTSDLDLLIMHQANLRINEAAQRQLGLPDSKVFNNIQNYGNTTSATLPLAFHEARQAGFAEEGSLVAFAALGAGLHWGAVLLRL